MANVESDASVQADCSHTRRRAGPTHFPTHRVNARLRSDVGNLHLEAPITDRPDRYRVLFLEIVFLASLFLTAFALFLPAERRPAFLRYRPAVPLTLAVVHVFIDHGRWQLVPAYALAAVLSVAAIFQLRKRDAAPVDRPVLRWIGAVVILLVTVASAAVAWLVPIFSLPAPSGKYKVGTRWLALTDSSRAEDLSPNPNEKRVVVVRLWFPADSVAGDPDEYIEGAVASGVAKALHLPGFALSHLPLVESHSYRRAWLPDGKERLPLLLFSHGYAIGTESQNTVQMEELASHGFVVASIDHPYETGAIVMPNGKVILANPPFAVSMDSATVAKYAATLARVQQAKDTASMRESLGAVYAQMAPLSTAIVRWTDDTRFVLNQLSAMSAPQAGADTLFPGRLESSRVGVFGMSFGGATAASFCIDDARCIVGINMDGLDFGSGATQPMRRPFIWMSSQGNVNVHRLFYERAESPVSLIKVAGAEHLDYTDLAYFAPKLAVRAKMLGGIETGRMQAIMNAVIVPYFRQALQHGAGIDTTQLKASYPEVTILSRTGVPTPSPAPPADTTTSPR